MSRCSPGCAPAPNVVPVVEAAAVIGRQIDRGLLCSVVDLSDDEVDDVIDELEDALVLEPWGTDGWRFRHELLREVAAELAPPSVRRGLHAKVADALVGGVAASRTGGWSPRHYERAERFDEAASAYQQASTDARRRGALAEARTYLTQALAQLDRATPGPDRDRREMAAAVGAGIPRRGRRGLSKPRRRRRLRAVPAAGRDRPARRRAVRDVGSPWRATTSRAPTCAGRPRCSSRCARASSRGGSGSVR